MLSTLVRYEEDEVEEVQEEEEEEVLELDNEEGKHTTST